MVAPQEEEGRRVPDLVAQEQGDGLDGLPRAIDVVAQEDVVRRGGEAADLRAKENSSRAARSRHAPRAGLEEPQQVMVLTVRVAADVQRRLQLEQHGLREEHAAARPREPQDVLLGEAHLGAWPVVLDSHELPDAGVEPPPRLGGSETRRAHRGLLRHKQ